MTRIHGLEEVECFGSADLADDDALRTHAKAVLHEIAHGDLARAFEVRRTCLKTDHVRLLQLQFSRIFTCNHTLIGVDEAGHAIEKRRLARTGTSGNKNIAADIADDAKDRSAFGRNGSKALKIGHLQLVFLEFSDREGRPIDGKRRRNHVDTTAIKQARVAYGRRFVDAPAYLAHDTLADIHQLRIVAESDAGLLNLARHFDKHPVSAVHHDVGNIVARKQRLEGAVAKDVVADILQQLLLLGDRHHDILDRDDLADDIPDLFTGRSSIELGKLRQVDGINQRVEDRRLDFVVLARTRVDPASRDKLGRPRRRGLRCPALWGSLGRRRRHGTALAWSSLGACC